MEYANVFLKVKHERSLSAFGTLVRSFMGA